MTRGDFFKKKWKSNSVSRITRGKKKKGKGISCSLLGPPAEKEEDSIIKGEAADRKKTFLLFFSLFVESHIIISQIGDVNGLEATDSFPVFSLLFRKATDRHTAPLLQ